MVIKKKARKNKIEIDLTGSDGNAFVLLGQARRLCQQLGVDFEPIEKEMTSSDYENLVSVFDKHFGKYVILYR